jgi:hypothetical protein
MYLMNLMFHFQKYLMIHFDLMYLTYLMFRFHHLVQKYPKNHFVLRYPMNQMNRPHLLLPKILMYH